MDSPKACGPPPPKAVYIDFTTAVTAIQAHAKCNDYALFKRDTKPLQVVYTCDRFGKAQARAKSSTIYTSKRRPNSGSKKCDCCMKLALSLDIISSHWHLTVLNGSYNHEASADPAAYPIYRTTALDSEVITRIKTLNASGLATAQILSVVKHQFSLAILA